MTTTLVLALWATIVATTAIAALPAKVAAGRVRRDLRKEVTR